MGVNLDNLCDFIIPQSLQENETINSLLQIYFKETNNLDVKNPLDLLNLDFLIDNTSSKTTDNIRVELMKIHLQELYNTLGDIGDDVAIYDKFRSIYSLLGLPIDDFNTTMHIEESINNEYISAARSFKTKKGNKAGFFFIYDLVNRTNIQKISTENHFKLLEGSYTNPNEPYVYRVETSLYKEIYKATIVPLSHPVGFEYLFTRIVYLILEDNYNYVESTELTELNIACYSYVGEDKVLKSIDGLSGIFGQFRNISTSSNLKGEVKAVIDFFPIQEQARLDGDNGIRLVKDYNGNLTVYTRQDDLVIEEGEFLGYHQLMEITDVELLDNAQGIMHRYIETKDILGKTEQVITDISYKEYTIMDKPNFKLRFKILGDKPDTWYVSTIALPDKSISLEKKFFNKRYISRKEILAGCLDYNGRVIEDRGNGCQFNYKVNYIYKLAVDDTRIDIYDHSIEDIWARKHLFNDLNKGFWIGEQIHDPSQTVINVEPFIGSTDEAGEVYEIGLSSDIKTDYMETEFGKWEDENLRAPVYKARIDDKNIIEKTDIQVENSEYIAWEKTSTTEFINATPSKEHFHVTYDVNYVGDALLVDNNLTNSQIEDFKLGIIRAEITGNYNLKYFKYDEVIDGKTYNFLGYSAKIEKVDADVVNLQFLTREVLINTIDFLLDDSFNITEEQSSIIMIDNITGNDKEYVKRSYFIGDKVNGNDITIGDFGNIDIKTKYKLHTDIIEYMTGEGDAFNNIFFDNDGNIIIKNLYDDTIERCDVYFNMSGILDYGFGFNFEVIKSNPVIGDSIIINNNLSDIEIQKINNGIPVTGLSDGKVFNFIGYSNTIQIEQSEVVNISLSLEYFESGIYRNGVLLLDNNVTKI